MLPSMPLISTPYKEDSRSSSSCGPGDTDESREQDEGDGDHAVSGDRAPGAVVTESCPTPACLKKTSPLKLVTPILKKYSSQRKVRGSRSTAGSPDQVVEKPGLRPIAPKPVVVMITSQPLDQDKREVPVTSGSAEQLSAVDTSLSPVVSSEQAKNNEAEAITDEKKTIDEVSKTEIVKDNEEDMAALMHSATTVSASPRVRPALSRKKTKQLKDMEATLNVLTDVDDAATKEEKASSFAHSYFMKVKERLEGREDAVYQQFLQTMNEFGQVGFSVAELYQRVTDLLGHHGDLASEFLAFLLPDQALQCGKFMEHLMITKMRDFFRKLECFFAKQPQHMKKIYSSLSVLSNQTNVSIADVQSTILPLLKGNTFLTHSFLELLPQECPPDSLMTEFEFVQCYDDSESEEELFEVVDVPDHPDPYGGNNCCCPCHDSTNEKYRTRVLHCIPCGTRFIHGRVFVETGKGLRHAKIIFSGTDGKANIQRLAAAKVLQRKGRRRRRTCGHIKKNRSPSKQAAAAAKVSSVEDNSTETANVQVTSKTLSPTSARSKTRTTNVSQKAREASTSIVAVNSGTLAVPPAEKKEPRSSPSKLGRQVASVRLCRVPSTVCSYTIVPSLKNTTRTSVSLAETRSRITVKSSNNETPPPSTTSSPQVADLNMPVEVRRPNTDQHRQQHQRQKKSVDSSACVSSDASGPNFDSSKSHVQDNVDAKCNVEAACNTESMIGTRKKRGANETDIEESQNQDYTYVCKIAKHFHGQVATRKDVDQSDKNIPMPDKQCSSSAETRPTNVCETEEASTETSIRSIQNYTRETEENQLMNFLNSEGSKSDYTERLGESYDVAKREEEVMCVEEVAGTVEIVHLDYSEENNSQHVEQQVSEVSVENRHEEDMITETTKEVLKAKDAPRRKEGRETCENIIEVEVSNTHTSENDVKNNPEPIEFDKITEMCQCGKDLKYSEKPEMMEMNYDCKSEKGGEILVELKHEGNVDKCDDNLRLSEEVKSTNVSQKIPEERLLMDLSGMCKYTAVEVVEMEKEESDEIALTDKVTDGRCIHKDDSEKCEMGKTAEENDKYGHGETTQICQDVEINIDQSSCQEGAIMMDDDEEKCEEINVIDMSTESICDTNEMVLVEADEENKCENSEEKYEVMEINRKQPCCEEVALTVSNEYKCEEIDVVEMDIEPQFDNGTGTDICDDDKLGVGVQPCEEVEMVGMNSDVKDDDGERSMQDATDSCECKEEVEKRTKQVSESEQKSNEDRMQTDVKDESRCEDLTGKHYAEVVETGSELNEEVDIKPLPWTRDEDKVILETFQVSSDVDDAFVSISKQLPSRTIKEIRTRFQTLMNLLQQLTGSSVSEDAGNSSK